MGLLAIIKLFRYILKKYNLASFLSGTGTGPVIAIVVVAIIIIVIIVIAVIARSQGMLCFADSNLGEDGKKSAAQFEALEKGDDLPEKELIKANTKPVVNSNE